MIVEASVQTLDLRELSFDISHTEDGQKAVGVFPAVVCPDEHRAVAVVLGTAECAAVVIHLAMAAGMPPEQIERVRRQLTALVDFPMLTPEDERGLFVALGAAMSLTLVRNGLEGAKSFLRDYSITSAGDGVFNIEKREAPPEPPSRANPEAN